MSQTVAFRRPNPDEYLSYFGTYIDLVPDGNILELMESQVQEFRDLLQSIPESDASVLHEPYTWTIKQVTGHLIDVERVFAYRALRFASGDLRPILGMDQNPWVENSDYLSPTLKQLADELEWCRRANLCFFNRLKPSAWDAVGSADGNEISVRALAYILVGHITYHLNIIRSRLQR